MSITVNLSIAKVDGQEYVTVTIQEQTLKSYESSSLLSDIGENMLKKRRTMVLDFSKVEFMDSLCFGAIANIVNKAKETDSYIKLRLSPVLTKFAKLLSLEKVVEIIP